MPATNRSVGPGEPPPGVVAVQAAWGNTATTISQTPSSRPSAGAKRRNRLEKNRRRSTRPSRPVAEMSWVVTRNPLSPKNR